jgi:hypothetical protein
MITYRMEIVVGGLARRLLVRADLRVETERGEVEFYADETLVAVVPASIILEMTED